MTVSQLSRQAIEKFQAIYEAEFGETISDAEAQEMALGLINLVKLMLEHQAKASERTTSF